MTAQVIPHPSLLAKQIRDAREERDRCKKRHADLFGRTAIPEDYYPELAHLYGSIEVAEEAAWGQLVEARAVLAALEKRAQGGDRG